ncbi:hypothetical protein TNCT_214121 [Trichonephila clavata]|uniref:Uncharacterized protein n=1 Tax=Trichonephila clavata TaxID=2740835 RepID=A0A8X6GE11_TRICU|nr:hypothetical protein TNCT_214121 [Trichonephila clavata]
MVTTTIWGNPYKGLHRQLTQTQLYSPHGYYLHITLDFHRAAGKGGGGDDHEWKFYLSEHRGGGYLTDGKEIGR